MIRFLLVSLFLSSAAPAFAAADAWRIYTGTHTTAWRTTGGHHGHDVDCPPAEQHDRCESSDFARANLDNSIGFRLGAEKRRPGFGRFDLVYGGELSVDSTEYNISQRDLYVGSAAVTAGAVTDFFHATWGLRGGAGAAATDDGQAGGALLAEALVEVPLTQAVRFRLAHRETAFLLSGESLRAGDTSFLLVFTETPSASPWTFSAGAGISVPGLAGEDLDLSRAPFARFTAARRLTDRSALGLSYITAAHESTRTSVFMGYPGNERGKTINGLGVEWTLGLRATPHAFVEAGAGVEVADWSDDHELLGSVDGSTDVSPTLSLTLGVPIASRLALTATAEQLYWTGIGLGETRFSVGVRR
jgi:hypothetical protein